ncbi:hypothetical protein C8R44DRAFT_756517, partial [Mycena epipterygia]
MLKGQVYASSSRSTTCANFLSVMAFDSAAIISVIFGFMNLLIENNDSAHTSQIICAFFTTGCINMLGAYLRRNREEGYVGIAFTTSLVISSLFNWI